MNYTDFIKMKNLTKRLYLIVGEEKFFTDKVEALIKQEFSADNSDGINIVSSDIEIKELKNLLNCVPFFSSHNVIIIKDFKLE